MFIMSQKVGGDYSDTGILLDIYIFFCLILFFTFRLIEIPSLLSLKHSDTYVSNFDSVSS